MTNRKTTDPRWRELKRRHPGHPALNDEAIYAIPGNAIHVLKDLNSTGNKLKHLLSEEELRFENDLAELGGTGFFLKYPIRYFSFPRPAIPLQKSKKQHELDQQHIQADESIREMLRDGRGPSEYTHEEGENRNADLGQL